MGVKEILENVVVELEEIQMLVAAIERVLIDRKELDSQEVESHLKTTRQAARHRLAAIRAEIARLS
jgi:hypothetical protein